MKWHRHLVDQLIEALEDTFGDTHRHADKVIQWRFKNNRKWGSRDRKFFAESFYEIVRYWRTCVEMAGFQWSDDLKLQTEDYKKVFSYWAFDKYEELPEWLSLSTADVDNYEKNKLNLTSLESIEAITDWMQQLGESRFGDNWPMLIESLNVPASLYLRVNTLKVTQAALLSTLKEEGLQVETVDSETIRVVERVNVFALDCFKKGLFEVQDYGSQQIAPFLNVEPGQRVLDACAGAGGKSLHLAALMQNKGKVIATDIHQWKLDELRKRSRRDGVDIIEAKVVTSKLIKRWKGSMDRLLLDVPCTGIGVLRRNPDTKWKLSQTRLDELVQLQQQILNDYSQVVKPGGVMVYSTCSVLPEENQQQVESFLASNSDWQLLEEKSLTPVESDQDGFYMARLKKQP